MQVAACAIALRHAYTRWRRNFDLLTAAKILAYAVLHTGPWKTSWHGKRRPYQRDMGRGGRETYKFRYLREAPRGMSVFDNRAWQSLVREKIDRSDLVNG